ncbi:MAG: CTP synthase [Bacteroidales bacterium OttesenSCG-928-I14]|jgi:CTP synthase|nr:CTP synthase [Bacteroidales bacterium OttesenSCG-928-I14]
MFTKYIFVTGGVVSSLGKGIVAASIGKLLQGRGYKVTIQKFDPYINIDPGTLNPYEHGECYVTSDGCETDLDLGHYERFLNILTSKANNVTAGRIYQNVINKERKGNFLGKTVQVIPHITDEIKHNIMTLGEKGDYDFIIIEIGGTVGDIESLPFLESVRQLVWELVENCLCIHLTYVPYIVASKEVKTKPTQHSVKSLQEQGIQPNILVLRTEKKLDRNICRKVALFCNVDESSVIQSYDVPSIYEVPIILKKQALDEIILNKMHITNNIESDITHWENFIKKMKLAEQTVTIGIVGKYADLPDAYKSISESLLQAATFHKHKLNLILIHSEKINEYNVISHLKNINGIIIAPGFGKRGIEGKLIALKYAREKNKPTFGICLGMQCMIIEFARNVLGLTDANSTEIDQTTSEKVIDLMEKQKHLTVVGGSMRLGTYECQLEKNSKAIKAYKTNIIKERHRHRYEFNITYKNLFEKKGMKCTGINPDTDLVEIIEIPNLNWYIGTQFHPEYQSTIVKPNPLFISFIEASISSINKILHV